MSHFHLITDNARWEGESNYFFASRNRVRTLPVYKWQQYLLAFSVNKMSIVLSKMAGGEWSLRLRFFWSFSS